MEINEDLFVCVSQRIYKVSHFHIDFPIFSLCRKTENVLRSNEKSNLLFLNEEKKNPSRLNMERCYHAGARAHTHTHMHKFLLTLHSRHSIHQREVKVGKSELLAILCSIMQSNVMPYIRRVCMNFLCCCFFFPSFVHSIFIARVK